VNSFAKLILLVLFAGVFLALMKGGFTGPGGVVSWLKAKFMGRVS
jgi:hypothetical protein